MTEQKSDGEELIQGAENFFGHVVAIVAGLILMVVGLAMGVTVVMLPVGIGVGLCGMLALAWGIAGRVKRQEAPPRPPTSP